MARLATSSCGILGEAAYNSTVEPAANTMMLASPVLMTISSPASNSSFLLTVT
jgi:hypothetical protein